MPVRARTREDILALLGDPKRVDKELRAFRRSSRTLSSDNPRLINTHPKKWVAIYGGRVRAKGKTFDSLMTEVDRNSLPRKSIIVRYIDRDERIMIL